MTYNSVPPRLLNLDRDPRGYIIPWGVYRDDTGRAHFQIADDRKRYMAMKGDLCPICGTRLLRGRWFVGGPLSAFHEHGAFGDPPMHQECARYALEVCPYLAMPRYSRRIDDRTLREEDKTTLLDTTMIERRPNVFVCLMTTRQRLTKGFIINVVPGRPYLRVEYWRHGKQLTQEEGEALVEADKLTWEAHLQGRKNYITIKTTAR